MARSTTTHRNGSAASIATPWLGPTAVDTRTAVLTPARSEIAL